VDIDTDELTTDQFIETDNRGIDELTPDQFMITDNWGIDEIITDQLFTTKRKAKINP
jgi:hypothetical protein